MESNFFITTFRLFLQMSSLDLFIQAIISNFYFFLLIFLRRLSFPPTLNIILARNDLIRTIYKPNTHWIKCCSLSFLYSWSNRQIMTKSYIWAIINNSLINWFINIISFRLLIKDLFIELGSSWNFVIIKLPIISLIFFKIVIIKNRFWSYMSFIFIIVIYRLWAYMNFIIIVAFQSTFWIHMYFFYPIFWFLWLWMNILMSLIISFDSCT